LDPDYALPYAALAWAYDENREMDLRERRDSSRAFAERVIRMAPELPAGYAELGWLHLLMGDLERGGEQLDEAVAYVRRALDTGWTGWYPSAPDPFLAAIESDPRYQATLTEVRDRRDRERERVAQEGI
jgi:tetratricopeptide (TPR) repeat protein